MWYIVCGGVCKHQHACESVVTVCSSVGSALSVCESAILDYEFPDETTKFTPRGGMEDEMEKVCVPACMHMFMHVP